MVQTLGANHRFKYNLRQDSTHRWRVSSDAYLPGSLPNATNLRNVLANGRAANR